MNAASCQYAHECAERLPFTGFDVVAVIVVAFVLIAIAAGIYTTLIRKGDE